MDILYDKRTTCCFTGHRNIPASVSDKLYILSEKAIEHLVNTGVNTFISGGALGFDIASAKAVLRLKERHPSIRLVMAIPCRDQHAKWCKKDQIIYEDILKVADEIYCLNDKYCTGCMHQRNRFMVEQSGYCIAYFTGEKGGTQHTVNLAKENHLKVINLAMYLD